MSRTFAGAYAKQLATIRRPSRVIGALYLRRLASIGGSEDYHHAASAPHITLFNEQLNTANECGTGVAEIDEYNTGGLSADGNSISIVVMIHSVKCWTKMDLTPSRL